MGKMEVIFNTDDIEATEDILSIIKEKDLFYKVEVPEDDKVEEVVIIDEKIKSQINSIKDTVDTLNKIENNPIYKF